MRFAPGATLASICLSMISYAEAQPSIVQPVVPGYQVPSAGAAGLGPTFQPNAGAGTPNQISASCGTTSAQVLGANAAGTFVLIKNPSTNTAAIWLNVAGSAAALAPPSLDLAAGNSILWSGAQGYLPTSQINCSASFSGSLTVIYR